MFNDFVHGHIASCVGCSGDSLSWSDISSQVPLPLSVQCNYRYNLMLHSNLPIFNNVAGSLELLPNVASGLAQA